MRDLEQSHASTLAGRLKAMTEPNRLLLLNRICADPGITQDELVAVLGTLRQPTVAEHLRVLKLAGLVDVVRLGRFHHYHPSVRGQGELADAVRRLTTKRVRR